jgi:hypothetical protein
LDLAVLVKSFEPNKSTWALGVGFAGFNAGADGFSTAEESPNKSTAGAGGAGADEAGTASNTELKEPADDFDGTGGASLKPKRASAFALLLLLLANPSNALLACTLDVELPSNASKLAADGGTEENPKSACAEALNEPLCDVEAANELRGETPWPATDALNELRGDAAGGSAENELRGDEFENELRVGGSKSPPPPPCLLPKNPSSLSLNRSSAFTPPEVTAAEMGPPANPSVFASWAALLPANGSKSSNDDEAPPNELDAAGALLPPNAPKSAKEPAIGLLCVFGEPEALLKSIAGDEPDAPLLAASRLAATEVVSKPENGQP